MSVKSSVFFLKKKPILKFKLQITFLLYTVEYIFISKLLVVVRTEILYYMLYFIINGNVTKL